MQFETPPVIPLWKTAVKRGKGTQVPRIEASARRVSGDVDAYAAVCGLPRADVLPACFPDLLCRGLQLSVLTDPAFPVGLMGIVHARQRIEQRRPIRRDEALSGRSFVEGHQVVRNGGEFDLHSEVSSGGEVVWRGVTTILSRDLPGDGVKRERVEPPAFVPRRSAAWRLPEDLGRRYAKVSGDVNPIHQYAWTAKLFGFKRAIIHGWWTLARCLAEMDLQPGALDVSASFVAPVLLPSTAWFASGPVEAGEAFEVRAGSKLALTGVVASR